MSRLRSKTAHSSSIQPQARRAPTTPTLGLATNPKHPQTRLPAGQALKRNSRQAYARSSTAAKRELAQQDLLIAVHDQPGQSCGLLENVSLVKAQGARIERGGAHPEIARAVLECFLLEPSENAWSNALTLRHRQQREQLDIRAR